MAPPRGRPVSDRWAAYRLPRPLHPVAWWLWALGMAVAASRTTNPVLLTALATAVSWVVVSRRSDAPWANAYRLYLLGGAVIVAIRVGVRIVLGGDAGGFVLLRLPSIPLPHAAAGIRLFGDVTAPALLAGLYDGLRLATMLICIGAANALANPRRLLRSMPPALHEVSTAVVVALSVFPQLAESVVRVRRARRLRPAVSGRRLERVRAIVVPVLEDALDRSLLLASSMDSRGYGRRGDRSPARARLNGVLMVLGVGGICVGVYGLLDATTPRYLAGPMLAAGSAVGVVSLVLTGAGVTRTSYRPDRWRSPELLTVVCGIGTALLVDAAARREPSTLAPGVDPLTWPTLSMTTLAAVVVAALPAYLAPRPGLVDETGGAAPLRAAAVR
jgi:energy-coupling factor transport system permease protein